MASAASHASFLPPVLTFCAAAVIAVPLFRRLGLSAVIGYLFAGVVIGPAGFSLIDDPGTAASVAELGVVLLLFIVGLELKLSRLLPCAATSSGSASPSSGSPPFFSARPRWRPASRRRRPW
jgi:Kef-type K+ transport system membrane component KefB